MRTLIVCAIGLAGAALVAQQSGVFSVLSSTVALGKQPGGYYLVPTNQMLRPWGELTVIRGRPVDMAFDSQKRVLAVLNTRSILFMDGSTGNQLAEVASKPTSYAGIAFRPGNRELWASEAGRNGTDSILIAQISELGMPGATSRIDLKGHPVPVGIAFSADGKTAYVAFSRSNTLAVIDAATHEITKEVEVGMAPFGVAVSKDRGRIYVTNRAGRRPAANDTVAPSAGSEVATDPVTGSTVSGTLSVIDGGHPGRQRNTRRPRALGPDPEPRPETAGRLQQPLRYRLHRGCRHARPPRREDPDLPRCGPRQPAQSPPSSRRMAKRCTWLAAATTPSPCSRRPARTGAWRAPYPPPSFPSAIAIDSQGALRVLNIKGVGRHGQRPRHVQLHAV